ncbi:hypothetical protein RZS08_44915, partial [Arthrospira platensis SPKY1]|nr:hypothetical protein [Arthrospira platensis SPKY1]
RGACIIEGPAVEAAGVVHRCGGEIGRDNGGLGAEGVAVGTALDVGDQGAVARRPCGGGGGREGDDVVERVGAGRGGEFHERGAGAEQPIAQHPSVGVRIGR